MTRYYVQNESEGAPESDAVEIELHEQADRLSATLDEEQLSLDLRKVSEPSLYSLVVNDRSYEVFVEERDPAGTLFAVLIGGEQFLLRVQDEMVQHLSRIQKKSRAEGGNLAIKAPMPGVVIGVEVSVGDTVQRGRGLVILGAMKMENQIKAPRDGVVQAIECEAGQIVEQGRVLITLA